MSKGYSDGEEGILRTDAEGIPAVHILIVWKLGGFLRRNYDTCIEGRREAWKAHVDSIVEPVDRRGELARRVVVASAGSEFLVLFIDWGADVGINKATSTSDVRTF
jgi:hypothetical protein